MKVLGLVARTIVFSVLLGVMSVDTVLAAVPPTYVARSTGVDVSWPRGNCQAAPKLLRSWAIIGASGGLDFRPNPCLRNEAARFSALSLYANSGYPGPSYAMKFSDYPKRCSQMNTACLAYDYGYNAGLYAVTYAASQDVHATTWWVDVETDNSWTANPVDNRASIQGEVDAIRRATLIGRVGIYSYPGQWDLITGVWRNGLPSWVATGSTKRQSAVAACTARSWDFTGGTSWLTQYTTTLDQDYVCQTH